MSAAAYDPEGAAYASGMFLGRRLMRVEADLWAAFEGWAHSAGTQNDNRNLTYGVNRFLGDVRDIYQRAWMDRLRHPAAIAQWATEMAALWRETWRAPVERIGAPTINLSSNTITIWPRISDDFAATQCDAVLVFLDWLATEDAINVAREGAE